MDEEVKVNKEMEEEVEVEKEMEVKEEADEEVGMGVDVKETGEEVEVKERWMTVDPECLRRIKTLHFVLYKSKYFPFPCIETFSCLSFKKFHTILRPVAAAILVGRPSRSR